jgi:outer membrane protein
MSMKFARRFSVSLLALAAPVALAQPISLRDAVQQALSHDPSLEQAEADVERSRAGVDAARAGRGLQAGLQAEVGAVETDFTQDRISQVPRSAGLQAEWTVFQSGALGAAVDAAKAQRDAVSYQMLGAREKLVLDTFEAYANAWLAERTVEVAEARVATFRIRLDETQARFDQGQVTRTDIALTEARLASAQAQREAARAALSGAWARLARLTGVDHAVTQETPELGEVARAVAEAGVNADLFKQPELISKTLKHRVSAELKRLAVLLRRLIFLMALQVELAPVCRAWAATISRRVRANRKRARRSFPSCLCLRARRRISCAGRSPCRREAPCPPRR